MVCPPAHMLSSYASVNCLTPAGASNTSEPLAGSPGSILPSGADGKSDEKELSYFWPWVSFKVHPALPKSCASFLEMFLKLTSNTTYTSPDFKVLNCPPGLVLGLLTTICHVSPTLTVSPILKCWAGFDVSPEDEDELVLALVPALSDSPQASNAPMMISSANNGTKRFMMFQDLSFAQKIVVCILQICTSITTSAIVDNNRSSVLVKRLQKGAVKWMRGEQFNPLSRRATSRFCVVLRDVHVLPLFLGHKSRTNSLCTCKAHHLVTDSR